MVKTYPGLLLPPHSTRKIGRVSTCARLGRFYIKTLQFSQNHNKTQFILTVQYSDSFIFHINPQTNVYFDEKKRKIDSPAIFTENTREPFFIWPLPHSGTLTPSSPPGSPLLPAAASLPLLPGSPPLRSSSSAGAAPPHSRHPLLCRGTGPPPPHSRATSHGPARSALPPQCRLRRALGSPSSAALARSGAWPGGARASVAAGLPACVRGSGSRSYSPSPRPLRWIQIRPLLLSSWPRAGPGGGCRPDAQHRHGEAGRAARAHGQLEQAALVPLRNQEAVRPRRGHAER